MKIKTSILAMSVALSLIACGSDDSHNPNSSVSKDKYVTGKFIDAAVEGLYYEVTPSGKTGFTDAQGRFDFTTGDTVSFFVGGKDGLHLGSASARDVVSPFTITGNYQKAVNLGRILQTFDDANDGFITLPDSLIAPSAEVISALNKVQLHDLKTATPLKTALNVEGEWITEEKALKHLNESLAGLEQGSKEPILDFNRGSGKYLRSLSIQSTIKLGNSPEQLSIHADRLLSEDVFNKTRVINQMTVQLNEEHAVLLKGSNDMTLSGDTVNEYLACLDEKGIDAQFIFDTINPMKCNGGTISQDVLNKFTLSPMFIRSILHPEYFESENTPAPWSQVSKYSEIYKCASEKSCSEARLTGFSISEYNDGEFGLKKRSVSMSYDSTAAVYSELAQVNSLSSATNIGSIIHTTNFSYIVDSPESERYVDFLGTWNSVASLVGCDKIAKSTLTFNETGVVIKGEEFFSVCELRSIDETLTYSQLASMDYWWFGSNGADKLTKATLGQLNTSIRQCDDDGYVIGNICKDIRFNSWEYMPAGKNWDQGSLNFKSIDVNGNITRISSLNKN